MLKHCTGTSQFIVKKERLMSDSNSTAKTCAKCGLEKATCEFPKSKRNLDGFYSYCKSCKANDDRLYRAVNIEKVSAKSAAYRAANKDKIKARGAAYYAANLDSLKVKQAAYYAENSEDAKARASAWYKANPDRAKATSAAYYAKNIEKIKTYLASWYVENTDSHKAKVAAYRSENLGKINAYRLVNAKKIRARESAYRAANPEKRRSSWAAWEKANPEARRIISQNRRSRKRSAGGKLSRGLSVRLFSLQKGKCPCCNQPLGGDYHLDHITPLALGGSNTDDNIQLLRAICNQQKHAKHPVDFMQSRGFLL